MALQGLYEIPIFLVPDINFGVWELLVRRYNIRAEILTLTTTDDKVLSSSSECAANHKFALLLSLEVTNNGSGLHID